MTLPVTPHAVNAASHAPSAWTALWRDALASGRRIARNENNCRRNPQFMGCVFGACGVAFGVGSAVWKGSCLWWLGLVAGCLSGLLFCTLFGLVWLRPQWFSGRQMIYPCFAAGMVGGLWGTLLGLIRNPIPEGLPWMAELEHVVRAAASGLPFPMFFSLVTLMALILTASQRQEQLDKELAYARGLAEQEAAKREATEARLRLLQAQIQPHFIFNTLAAVQHWVDAGDARASGLLRSLTAFLRGSAELLNQTQVTLAQELPLVERYLEVMQARWGQRLNYRIQADPAVAAAAVLPPGLVLTLVENALEHGVAPSLTGAEVSLILEGDGLGGWTLWLDDSGVGLSEGWAEGMGLGNCRARLEHLFPGQATLTLAPHPRGQGTRAVLAFTAPKTPREAA